MRCGVVCSSRVVQTLLWEASGVGLRLQSVCMQMLLSSETDAAGRLARLQQNCSVDQSDWSVVLAHTVTRAASGRASMRLYDRLWLLPLSHHHRFPIYEQASWQHTVVKLHTVLEYADSS